jgi:tRNA pseudouridine13 synthase
VTLAHFEAAHVEGTRRLGRLLLPDCIVEANETLQGVTVSFSLPKGAFATTILREVMKVDTAQMPEVDEDDEG